MVRIHIMVRFEPNKVNIFNKDCRRGGKDVTCMSAIVCLNVTSRTYIRPTQEIGEWFIPLIVYRPVLEIGKILEQC